MINSLARRTLSLSRILNIKQAMFIAGIVNVLSDFMKNVTLFYMQMGLFYENRDQQFGYIKRK